MEAFTFMMSLILLVMYSIPVKVCAGLTGKAIVIATNTVLNVSSGIL